MARTPSASAHLKVLEAAAELVAERGIESTSMDAIALKSGVSKATIYNHWPDKDALLIEMLAHIHQLGERPKFDSGDTRADMIAVLAYRPTPDAGHLRERIGTQFAAYSANHREFGKVWRSVVMDPPRAELRRLLAQGAAKGELQPDIDEDFALALLVGPVMYWFIFFRLESESPESLAIRVVDAFWRAYGTAKRKR